CPGSCARRSTSRPRARPPTSGGCSRGTAAGAGVRSPSAWRWRRWAPWRRRSCSGRWSISRAGAHLLGRRAGSGLVLGALLALLGALLALEVPLAGGLRRAGARLEERLRALYLHKIPRLPDRYFQSRPVSDLAERAHLLHRLRALPTLGGEIARAALEIAVLTAGLCWVYPPGAALAVALGATM